MKRNVFGLALMVMLLLFSMEIFAQTTVNFNVNKSLNAGKSFGWVSTTVAENRYITSNGVDITDCGPMTTISTALSYEPGGVIYSLSSDTTLNCRLEEWSSNDNINWAVSDTILTVTTGESASGRLTYDFNGNQNAYRRWKFINLQTETNGDVTINVSAYFNKKY